MIKLLFQSISVIILIFSYLYLFYIQKLYSFPFFIIKINQFYHNHIKSLTQITYIFHNHKKTFHIHYKKIAKIPGIRK
jgi:hypothetical protein